MSTVRHCFVNAPDPENPLSIEPVCGRIGAEIRDVDLSAELDEATVNWIRAALLRHKVIFFRNQSSFGDAEHERLTRYLGTPSHHPIFPPADRDKFLIEIRSTKGTGAHPWHTDITYLADYPAISILRAMDVPSAGGDTMWANTATAYQDLPDPLKLMVESLRAHHTNLFDYSEVVDVDKEELAKTAYLADHPVVTVHPETGERTLLTGLFIKNFVGVNDEDTRAIIQILQSHITYPDNTVRWRWRNGDVVLWDNRATQHRVCEDFGNQLRLLRRTTVAGTIAKGIDGNDSIQLSPQ